MTKPLFEVINPSDPVTFYADSFELAVALNIMISHGQFGIEQVDVPDNMFPPMLAQLSGAEALESWCQSKFGLGLNPFLDKVCDEYTHEQMAHGLLTAATVSGKMRPVYDTGFSGAQDKDSFFYQWDDDHRSSFSKIAKCFYENGKRILKNLKGATA